jgi:excisionase family DNA binding protein
MLRTGRTYVEVVVRLRPSGTADTGDQESEVTDTSECVTPREAAERLGVTKNTMASWLIRGLVQGTQEAPRRRWRIPASEIDRVARERRVKF